MKNIKKILMILSFLLMVNMGSVCGMDLIIGGDNLGSHTAAQDLDMAGHSIVDVDSVTANNFIGLASSSTYSADSDLLDGHDSTYFAIKADVATSTNTLQTNINNEETSRIDEDVLLSASTGQLQIDLATEVSDRISEDNLISDATGQIRTDFEAYDSTLNTSTSTLRTDLGTAETAITTLETSTGTLEGRLDVNESAITTLETSTGTLEGRLDVNELAITTLETSTGTLQSNIDALNIVYLGINAKADDANLLDGYNYDYFVDTVTTQNIGGAKTFDDDLTVNGTSYSNTSYAHGYVDINTDTTVSVSGSTDTFTIFNPTWSSIVTPIGFSISGATATYTGIGGTPKRFVVHGGFSMDSDDNSTTAYVALFKNGLIYRPSIRNDFLAATAGNKGELSSSTLIELETGDKLDIRFSADKSATLTIAGCEFIIDQKD